MPKRISYTKEQMAKLLVDYRLSGLTIRGFSHKVNVPFSNLTRWLKDEERKIEPTPKKVRGAQYPELESRIVVWILAQRARELIVTNSDVRNKALELTKTDIKYLGFVASDRWVINLKKRNRLSCRIPTHASLKTVFNNKRQEADLEEFFFHVVEALEVDKIPLCDILIFDQTNVRLVAPQPKTISPIGVKQVDVIHPPGEKEGFTIALAIQADGTKLPAVVVFKVAKRTGLLSPSIMAKLKIPNNVIVRSSRTAWWSELLHLEWINKTFSVAYQERVLVIDQFSVHKMESCRELLEERNIRLIFVPAGMTGKHQPLDVGVNKPFKSYYREEYHKWRSAALEVTKSGYLRKPGRQAFLDMVSTAWEKVSAECVRKSFVGAKIVTTTVSSENDQENVIPAGSTVDDDNVFNLSFCNETSFFDDEDAL